MATALQLAAVTILGRWRAKSAQLSTRTVLLRYKAGRGSLRNALAVASERGTSTAVVDTRRVSAEGRAERWEATVDLIYPGKQLASLLADLADVPGVRRVRVVDEDGS